MLEQEQCALLLLVLKQPAWRHTSLHAARRTDHDSMVLCIASAYAIASLHCVPSHAVLEHVLHVQYLKSIRLERNRKTGFKCPRGCGKGTQHPGPCPGKIDKSHPIHPRNEEQKKKKKVSSWCC
jgi:hypothetical protein